MTVRDLITELLAYDIEQGIEIEVITEENDVTISDFVVEEIGYTNRRLTIGVKPEGYVLVDESDYEALKDENSHYENRIAELENAIGEYERQIEVLESGE